ncbi:uncharacterized protein LOC124796046 [Schistocerca piceifrons]|uniref:uncharacterized protein LOC124796046 n=1 Tax=Schistocerca piceifrons TaxID=274613 RepID=UPI001F5F6E59|nr:uncharacterized protein LOC124796046 [Schistocerca piceifrons]
MGRKEKETTIDERNIVVAQYFQHKSYAEIANIIGRSRATVQSIVKRYKDRHVVINSERHGRPQKLTTREPRMLLRIIKKNPKTTASTLSVHVHDHFRKDITPERVCTILNRSGYRARIPRRKPYISKKNTKWRM